ncbi:MAG: helix-turn-helix domain-containing protein [Porticoccaceae bacterium]
MPRHKRNYSKRSLQAMKVFAKQIQIARKEHRWTEAELAERAGTTRPTIRQIEKGSPSTGLGLYFEVATLLGIPLFATDERNLTALESSLDMRATLLPRRIDKEEEEVFDDF